MFLSLFSSFFFFFFNDTATTEIYTLSLHDALPISAADTNTFVDTVTPTSSAGSPQYSTSTAITVSYAAGDPGDRKSTRLNSSHDQISYAVFCLKKKKKNTQRRYNIDNDTCNSGEQQ